MNRKLSIGLVWGLAALLLAVAFLARTARELWPEWRAQIRKAEPEPAPIAKTPVAAPEPIRKEPGRPKKPVVTARREPEPLPEPLPEIDTRPARTVAEMDRIALEDRARDRRTNLANELEKRRPGLLSRSKKRGNEGREAKNELGLLDRTIEGLTSGKKPAKVARIDMQFAPSWGWLDTKENGSDVVGFHVFSVYEIEIVAKAVSRGEYGFEEGQFVHIRGVKTAGVKEGGKLELRGLFRLYDERQGGDMVRVLEPLDPWEKPPAQQRK